MRKFMSGLLVVLLTQLLSAAEPVAQADEAAYARYQDKLAALPRRDREAFVKGEPALTEKEQRLEARLAAERDAMKEASMRSAAGRYAPFLPAEPFYKVRSAIENHPTFPYFRQMPKGGNLHIHTSAAADIDKFLDILTHDPRVYAYWGEDNATYIKGQLFYLQYPPRNGDFKPLGQAVVRGELRLEELKSLLTISDDRADTIPYIWDEFNQIFKRVSPVLKTRPIYDAYYESALRTQLENQVDYLELRFGAKQLVDSNDLMLPPQDRGSLPTGFSVNQGSWEESARRLHQIWQKVRLTAPDFTLKLIVANSRSAGTKEVLASLRGTEAWRKDETMFAAENFIAGFDLVGEEDRNHTTDYYAKTILVNDIQLPFYFHDGETNWADSNNLHAAYLLKTRRIGHGFSAFRYPNLLEAIKRDGVCLEICPISNQVLRYTPDLRMHPVGELLNRNIPFVICSDDPQIFADAGLSYDFWELYFSQDIDLRALKKIIKNSYTYSALRPEEKKAALANWQKKWDAFIESLSI